MVIPDHSCDAPPDGQTEAGLHSPTPRRGPNRRGSSQQDRSGNRDALDGVLPTRRMLWEHSFIDVDDACVDETLPRRSSEHGASRQRVERR